MFVFMLIASGLLVSWGAFLILTGDYIATLDIAATLLSAGVISFCLAFLTRTIASIPAQIAQNAAAITKNTLPQNTSASNELQGAPVAQTDVSSITKAIAKATTPQQSAFGFSETSGSQPALPLTHDKEPQVKHSGFAERNLPPLPPRPVQAAPHAGTPAVESQPRTPLPMQTAKTELLKTSAPAPMIAPATAEITPPEATSAALEASAPARLAQRPIIPPMAQAPSKHDKTPPADAIEPSPQPSGTETLPELTSEEERLFLKEGSIDGTIYRFYSDGSAETDTPNGVQYFASIDEVRNSILLSRISLDMEETPSETPPSPQENYGIIGWNTRAAPSIQDSPASPFAFTPSRYAEEIPPASSVSTDSFRHNQEMPNQALTQNAPGSELLDSDEWAEPFRMLLRKDKNPQG